jgi:hypothetical protein
MRLYASLSFKHGPALPIVAPLDSGGRVGHDGLPDPNRPAGACNTGILDRLLGKPSVAAFADEMIQAFREAGDVSDLRYDAAENCTVRRNADAGVPIATEKKPTISTGTVVQ